MAQVPNYNPVPTVAPQPTALPSVHVDSPIAAFGGATAEAIKGLGGTLGHVGDELFARAQALQQLKNETDAKDEDVKFMISAGEIHAKYNELQGAERVAAFPKYSEDLQSLYKSHRSNLGNPMAQRMFDSSAVSTLQRSIFNGAGAAATAQREAALTAINAQEKLYENRTFDGSEADFRDGLMDVERTAGKKAGLMSGGWSQAREDLIKAEGKANLAYNRVLGKARNEPYQASQLLEQYRSEGLLYGQRLIEATNKVQSFTQSVGTDIISNKVLDKYRLPEGGFSKSASEMRDEAVDQAQKIYPNDPKMASATQAVFDRNYNQHNWAQHQDELVVKKQLDEYMVKGAMSVDVLPQDLVKRMTPAQIAAYPAQANRYRKSVNEQTNYDIYHSLLGMYNDDNAKFMDINIMSIDGLSRGNRNDLLHLQRQAQANGDPRVSRAMGWLNSSVPGAMAELGVDKKGDERNKFVGALHEAIQAWQEEKGKPPTEKDITKEIFPTLTSKITDPTAWFGSLFGKVPLFSAPVPAEYKQEMEKREKKELSDEELRKMFTSERFRQLYEKQKPTKDQGRVGQ